MSFTNGVETNILKLLFTAVAWTSIADNTATTPATAFFASLHNADPGDVGSQTTNETAYTNYARVSVARTTGGFTVSGTDPTIVQNAAIITFPTCGVTGDTITHMGFGLLASGAGTLLMSAPVGLVQAVEFTATAAAPGVFTCPGYTPVVNDRVSLYHNPAAVLPTGVTEGTVYFIGTAPGGQTFTLSTTTANGAPVTTSTTGSGFVYKQSLLVVGNGVAPTFAAGAFTQALD